MKRLASLVLLGAISLGAVLDGQISLGGQNRPARDSAPETGTAVIHGRVTAADTGAPLRGAQVQASQNRQQRRAALTDADGRFELRDLPAGPWRLRASKAGFVAQEYGQRAAFTSSQPIEVSDGQQFAADFALTRGGAISGRVFDQFGDPVVNARLAALRVQSTSTGPRLVSSGSNASTDDRGEYRLFGLAPGDYFVSVEVSTGNALISGPLATGDGPITYATMYFPGTADLGTAQRIAVGPGQEQPGINLTVAPVRAVQISGTVLDAAGMLVRAVVTLHTPMRSDGLIVDSSRAGTGRDGTFTFRGVSPGSYVLDVVERGRSSEMLQVASLPLVVGGSDIAGLTITTGSGATIIGTVGADDDGGRMETAGIRVTAAPTRTGPGSAPRAEVTPAGTFELTGLIGPHHLRLDRLPAGWVVKSVTANGLDVSDLAVDFRGNEQASVRVTLTDRITEVSGFVRADTTAAGATVAIFPDDETKWSFVSRYLRTGRVNDDGSFTIRALPPHERYLAIALDYLETGEHLEPAFLRRLKAAATSFGLSEGGQRTLDLRLSARP